jgi:hypothetical protein
MPSAIPLPLSSRKRRAAALPGTHNHRTFAGSADRKPTRPILSGSVFMGPEQPLRGFRDDKRERPERWS